MQFTKEMDQQSLENAIVGLHELARWTVDMRPPGYFSQTNVDVFCNGIDEVMKVASKVPSWEKYLSATNVGIRWKVSENVRVDVVCDRYQTWHLADHTGELTHKKPPAEIQSTPVKLDVSALIL